MIKIYKILPLKIKIYFFIGVFVIVLNVISSLFLPFFLSQYVKIISQFSTQSNSNIVIFGKYEIYSGPIVSVFNVLTAITLSLIVVSLITSIIGIVITTWAGELTSYHLRKKLFFKIQQLNLIDIAKFKPESIINRVSNDISQYWDFLISATSSLIRAPLLIFGAAVFMFITDSTLSISFLILIPIFVAVLWTVFKKSQPLLKENQIIQDLITKEVDENILGIRQIKIYNTQPKKLTQFHQENEKWLSIQKRVNNLFAIMHPVFFTLINLVTISVFAIAAYFINSTPLSANYLSSILAFIDYIFAVAYGIFLLSEFLVIFFRGRVSSTRINEILDWKCQELQVGDGIELINKNPKGCSVEFKNLSFKYYEKSKKYALKNINLKLKPGEILGIIGPTGSGKSTIANLLVNNFKYNKGSIKIDDIEVNKIDLKSLRKNVGIVFQDPLLYYGTIKSNLLFAKKDASEEQINKAIKSSCAIDFINSFEDTLDHRVIQGGKNLSGGQKQRLSVARTLLAEPKLLILDDSTSALDNITTSKLLTNIKDQYNCTTVIISQKINSIKHANKIIVMDKSEIIDTGTHEELVDKNEWYSHVYNNQLEQ